MVDPLSRRPAAPRAVGIHVAFLMKGGFVIVAAWLGQCRQLAQPQTVVQRGAQSRTCSCVVPITTKFFRAGLWGSS